MSPKVSIIVPIYNVENYLVRCIESLINQSYKEIEIILVNDGSKDSCGVICNKLQNKDDRIVVIHQENGGLSDARNTGLKKASGDYIFYLDSDDWLKEYCIERLVTKAQEYKADIVQCNFYYTYPEHLLQDNRGFKAYESEKLLNSEQALDKLIANVEIKNFAWGKLIRSEIAEEEFFPKGKLFEDTFWTHRVISKAKRYLVLKEPLLFYLQRDNSISYNKFDKRNLDRLEGMLLRYVFISKNHPELSEFMLIKCLEGHIDMFYQAIQCNENILAKTIRYKYLELYLELNGHVLNKAKFWLFKASPYLFQQYKLVEKIKSFIRRGLGNNQDGLIKVTRDD